MSRRRPTYCARAHLEAPYLAGPRLWAARLELPEPLLAYLGRHGAPIRYGYARRARRSPSTRPRTRSSRQRGDAERRAPADRRGRHRARGEAGCWWRPSCSTPASPRPSATSGRTPSATASRATARSSRRAGWGGRVIAVGTTVVRALETVAGPTGRSRRARVDRARRHSPARRARGRWAAHRLARARGLAPAHARGRRRPATCSSAPTPRRRAPATSGTSSETCTCSCRSGSVAPCSRWCPPIRYRRRRPGPCRRRPHGAGRQERSPHRPGGGRLLPAHAAPTAPARAGHRRRSRRQRQRALAPGRREAPRPRRSARRRRSPPRRRGRRRAAGRRGRGPR